MQKQKLISKMSYMEIENSLRDSLNSRLNKKSVSYIRELLKGLNTEQFSNRLLSVKFLKGLLQGDNKRRKHNIVYQIVKRAELKTHYQNRYFKEFDNKGNLIKTKECLRFITA